MPHDICQSIAIILSNYSSYTHVTRAIFYFIRKWLRAQLRVKTHNRLRKRHHISTNKSGVEKTKHLGTHTLSPRSLSVLDRSGPHCAPATPDAASRAPCAHRAHTARTSHVHRAHTARTVRAPYAHRTRTVRAPYAHRTRTARQLYARIAHCTRAPPYIYGSPLSWKALS